MRHAGLLIFWMMATYTKSYKLGECQHVGLAQLSAQNSLNIRLSHEARRIARIAPAHTSAAIRL